MKQLLAASVAVVSLVTAAQAQDRFDWTGLYVGVEGGFGESSTDFAASSTAFAGSYGENVFLGGLFVGGDWQAGPFVVGALADVDWTSGGTIEFGNVDPVTAGKGEAYTYDVDWVATARARVGYTPTERLLVYATGGVAAGRFEATSYNYPAFGSPASASFSGVKWGGVGGAGVEYQLSRHLSLKGEYLLYRFDDIAFESGGLADARFKPKLDTMKIGFALRF